MSYATNSMPSSDAVALLPLLARQNVLARPVIQELLCVVYAVRESWEAVLLAEEPDIHTLGNAAGLDAAMGDHSIKTLLIPASAGVDAETLRQALRWCPRSVTLFWQPPEA